MRISIWRASSSPIKPSIWYSTKNRSSHVWSSSVLDNPFSYHFLISAWPLLGYNATALSLLPRLVVPCKNLFLTNSDQLSFNHWSHEMTMTKHDVWMPFDFDSIHFLPLQGYTREMTVMYNILFILYLSYLLPPHSQTWFWHSF